MRMVVNSKFAKLVETKFKHPKMKKKFVLIAFQY